MTAATPALLARARKHLFVAVVSDTLDNTTINLACQKTQRQPDHPRGMTKHALDRVMRLAGVGRPENGRHTARSQRWA